MTHGTDQHGHSVHPGIAALGLALRPQHIPTAAMWFERVTQLLRKRISSCEIQIITPPQSVGPSVSQGNSICQGWESKGVQLLLSELPGSVFLGRLFVAHWGEDRGFEALL